MYFLSSCFCAWLTIFTVIKFKETIFKGFLTFSKRNDNIQMINYGECLKVEVTYMGQKDIIWVPYHTEEVFNGSELNLELYYEDESEKPLNINQMIGVPYLLSAKKYGGKYILATNTETGASFKYEDNHIPYFCKEIFL